MRYFVAVSKKSKVAYILDTSRINKRMYSLVSFNSFREAKVYASILEKRSGFQVMRYFRKPVILQNQNKTKNMQVATARG